MRGKTELSPKMVLVAATIAARGPMQAQQTADATGLSYHTARQYLRRCAFRGLVTVDHVGRVPAYTVNPTWRERLEPKKPPAKPKPETTVAKAIARAPALHTIWMN